MQRERLTPERIRAFTCPDGVKQAFLWDTEAPRLAVRATAGAKSFIFESKLNRQTIRVTIGNVKAWVLESVWEGKGAERRELQRGAREEANRMQALVDQGIDPRQEKAERATTAAAKRDQVQRDKTSALVAWADYIEARRHQWQELHLKAHIDAAKTGGEDRTRGKKGKIAPGILRPLLTLPLAQITATRVQAWLKDEASRRPTRARGAYVILRAFINWCAYQPDYSGQVQPDACAAQMTRQELPPKRAKKDSLLREQLPAWFDNVRNLKSPVCAAYLQCLLLTGARPCELILLKWIDVDMRWNSLTLRDKIEGERIIPLTPYVRSVIATLPRGEWVFASPRDPDKRMSDPNATHDRACERAGIEALTLHGLRRSFGSLSEWVESPAGVVAQIQGHKPSATAEKHYRVRPLDLLRMWHTRIETWILEQAGVALPATDQEPPLRLIRSNTAASR